MKMKMGDRVRVNDKIQPGAGTVPKPGDLGTIERVNHDGTVIVQFEDGRRGWLASWEVDPV